MTLVREQLLMEGREYGPNMVTQEVLGSPTRRIFFNNWKYFTLDHGD